MKAYLVAMVWERLSLYLLLGAAVHGVQLLDVEWSRGWVSLEEMQASDEGRWKRIGGGLRELHDPCNKAAPSSAPVG